MQCIDPMDFSQSQSCCFSVFPFSPLNYCIYGVELYFRVRCTVCHALKCVVVVVFKLINRFTVHLDSSLPKIGLNRPFVSPNLLIYEFLNKWNKLRYRKWFRRQQNDKMTISQCWTLLTVCCLVCLVFVPRCFAPDALCWNLWIRCSLLAARPNWGLCGHKTDGVGARGVGAGGEARISSQAS